VTAIADLITPADRDRLTRRLAELRDLADTMRKPGGMPAVPEPPALHRMAGRGPRTSPHTRGGAAPKE
jgi:hypothetical protein